MAPSTQTALVLPDKYEAFKLGTINVPRPGPGEVLVKIQSVAANPLDWKVRKYNVIVESYPVVLGSDIAGDIEEGGEGVSNLSVGDRVLVQSTKLYRRGGSGFQQYGVFPAPFVVKIPANITYDAASTIPVCLVTSFCGLFNKHPNGLGIPNPLVVGRNKSAGEAIVIIAGATSLGQFAIQCAKLAGFTVITTASIKHVDYLKSLGANHVIDRHLSTEAVAAEITKILDGQPLKYSVDTVTNAETGQMVYDLLTPDGHHLMVGPDYIQNKAENKRVSIVYGWASADENSESVAALYKHLTTLLEEGAIKPNRVEVVPTGLAGIPNALERLEKNQVSGVKLVVRPHETP